MRRVAVLLKILVYVKSIQGSQYWSSPAGRNFVNQKLIELHHVNLVSVMPRWSRQHSDLVRHFLEAYNGFLSDFDGFLNRYRRFPILFPFTGFHSLSHSNSYFRHSCSLRNFFREQKSRMLSQFCIGLWSLLGKWCSEKLLANKKLKLSDAFTALSIFASHHERWKLG